MNKKLIAMRSVLFPLMFIVTSSVLLAQNPHRFDADIEKFKKLSVAETEDLVIFTGSSSIRFWKEADNDCSEFNVINTGFGGSQMSDLLYFLDETVLRFNPSKVFIYEGDNDINAGKEPTEIIKMTRQVTERILEYNPETEIYYIGAKPSPSRWELKNKYLLFNVLLKDYCKSQPQLHYIDVWYPMLNESGRPDPQIFVKDSLHMNRKGYVIWKDIICKYTE